MAQPLRRRSEEGFGLLEAVVALFLLALVMVPVTRMALTSGQVSDDEHLRVEAADLASSALANVAYRAAESQQWSEGVTTSTQTIGGDRFVLSVDVEPVDASVQCADGGVPQAWSVGATVAWGNTSVQAARSAGDTIVQSTLIPAPSSTSAAGSGEIAIPVYGPGAVLETSQPVTVTLTGQCTGASCPAPPYPAGPPYATESVSTGTSGCAIFTDLHAGDGWSYTATISGSNGYVDPAEQSTGPGASEPALSATLTASAGTVTTVPAAGAFLMAPADPVAVSFVGSAFPGSSVPPSLFVPALPITLDSIAAGPSCSQGCALGDGASSFNGQQAALLYPPTESGSPGADDYRGYPGTWPSASPTSYCPGGVTGCPYASVAFDSASGSVKFPVYPLELSITRPPSPPPAIEATPVGTSMQLPLAPSTGTALAEQSNTGLPLGLYQLSSSASLALPKYVWVTPSGICSYSTGAAPSAPCATPATTPIVVAG